jgi:hypothetical protein
VAINYNGFLCFWFSRQTYWQGIRVRAYIAHAGRRTNAVTSIIDSEKPVTATKEVNLKPNLHQVLRDDNFNSYAPSLTGANAYGTWGISVTGSSAYAATAGRVYVSLTGTNNHELVRADMADNDQFRILVGGTASNQGFVEFATADDGTEPIYVRQYTGVFSSLHRSATLLDESGNTSFPGVVTANTYFHNAWDGAKGLASDSVNYVSTKSHGNSMWLRNVSGTYTFQGYSGGDNWGQSVQIYLPDASSEPVNALMVSIGQQRANTANGSYRGVSIVKYESSSVVPGDFTAGDSILSKATFGARTNGTSFGGSESGFTNTKFVAEFRSNVAPAATWHYENIATAHIILDSDGSLNIARPYGENAAILKVQGGSGSIYSGSMFAPIYYDKDDTNYYIDPNGTSRINQIYIGAIGGVGESSSYADAAVEIRERYFGGVQEESWVNAPRLSFHWGGRAAAQIGMSPSGRICVRDNPGTGDDDFQCRNVFAQTLYDSNDTSFFVDPAGYSRISSIRTTGRIYSDDWIEFQNSVGLYSTINSAHFFPNNGQYGSWQVLGAKDGWRGLNFENSIVLMMNDNCSGHHKNGYGWQYMWENGTLYCFKNAYGGGSQATVWDAVNAPRANRDNLMYYQGFALNANDMDTNSTGFTYAVNAPYTGPIARLSARRRL